ncbi:MAG: response regulator [Candidatus Yonathbacteria bacterium]|nr:response regulator [Candidatus Yonathbacteria bacterium]NTW47924.1 response regulator [Candidatus Yonathbacteria bacterium]
MDTDIRAKKIILTADDEDSLRRVMHAALSHAGYDVIEAKNGQEAVTSAREHHPDLILLDIMMPVMDGREALRILRETEETTHIPVILLTNISDMDYVAEVTAYPHVDYLVKADMSITDVVKKIDERLT